MLVAKNTGTSKKYWIWLLLATIAVIVVVIVSLGARNLTTPGTTLTTAEAQSQAQAYGEDFAKHLPSGVSAKPAQTKVDGCASENNEFDPSAPKGREQVTYSYTVAAPPSQNQAIFDTMNSYWKERGYRVTSTFASPPEIHARNDQDAFTFGISSSVAKTVTVSVASPCVWPKGVQPTQ